MSSQNLIKLEVEKLINNSKESLKTVQRFALDEAWKLLQLTTASVVQIIEGIGNDLSGPDKKALAMELLNNFYDKIFLVVDVPFVPNIVEPIIHKYVKQILMILVSASVDAIVKIFRDTGVFLNKRSNNG